MKYTQPEERTAYPKACLFFPVASMNLVKTPPSFAKFTLNVPSDSHDYSSTNYQKELKYRGPRKSLGYACLF